MRRFFTPPLVSKLPDGLRSNANPRTLRCSVRDRPTAPTNKRSDFSDRLFVGAEGGIRTLVWCYPQTDFESVRLLGSYRTILPQSRLILVVVFQLLNASAIMSSLLDRWREGQTHWRYYSTKTPKNQGVLRK